MSDQKSLLGWTPVIGDGLTVDEVAEYAFQYRGDVTIERADGEELIGYVYNRDSTARTPFMSMYRTSDDADVTVPYGEIRAIRFTGRDTAVGKSYEAWQRRREAKAKGAPQAGPEGSA